LAQGGKIGAQHIRQDDLDARVILEILLEALREQVVKFDGDHFARAPGQKRGHGAAPWANLKHQVVCGNWEHVQNPAPIPLVVEKMLAEFGTTAMDFGPLDLEFTP
jgi:hypothetical protein